jgi:hypothetical protein
MDIMAIEGAWHVIKLEATEIFKLKRSQLDEV